MTVRGVLLRAVTIATIVCFSMPLTAEATKVRVIAPVTSPQGIPTWWPRDLEFPWGAPSNPNNLVGRGTGMWLGPLLLAIDLLFQGVHSYMTWKMYNKKNPTNGTCPDGYGMNTDGKCYSVASLVTDAQFTRDMNNIYQTMIKSMAGQAGKTTSLLKMPGMYIQTGGGTWQFWQGMVGAGQAMGVWRLDYRDSGCVGTGICGTNFSHCTTQVMYCGPGSVCSGWYYFGPVGAAAAQVRDSSGCILSTIVTAGSNPTSLWDSPWEGQIVQDYNSYSNSGPWAEWQRLLYLLTQGNAQSNAQLQALVQAIQNQLNRAQPAPQYQPYPGPLPVPQSTQSPPVWTLGENDPIPGTDPPVLPDSTGPQNNPIPPEVQPVPTPAPGTGPSTTPGTSPSGGPIDWGEPAPAPISPPEYDGTIEPPTKKSITERIGTFISSNPIIQAINGSRIELADAACVWTGTNYSNHGRPIETKLDWCFMQPYLASASAIMMTFAGLLAAFIIFRRRA